MKEDVLHLIFERFNLQPGSHTTVQTKKDLLSAAKTSRAFVVPALTQNLLFAFYLSFASPFIAALSRK